MRNFDIQAGPQQRAGILTAAEFRQLVKAGKRPADDAIVRKQFAVSVAKAADDKPGLYDFTISTADVDREGDTVSVDGWDFGNYLRNPVVMWAHDYRQLPVGRSVDIRVEGGKVRSLTEFTPADLYPFGDQVRQFYESGFLSAVSVGFIPRKWSFVESDDRPFGIDFEEQELLEYSAVPVPANPFALIESPKSLPSPIGAAVAQSRAAVPTRRELELRLMQMW